MYDSTATGCSSPLPCPDDISVFLHHLLHPSSTSSSTPAPHTSSPLFSPNPHFKSLLSQDHYSPSTDDSSSFLLPPHHDFHMRESGVMSHVPSGDCEAVAVSVKRRKVPVENDFDDDCESEEGLEGSEGPSKSAPSRSSSKRSRAAEVHNLSEKRRRSRINEKMKALQNLIPNSNKTDKASMLDEAIEYLKQLQLQVQMLSMRNGFSLHPMYLPGVLQPPQLPMVRMGFNEGNGLPQMSMGHDTLPVNPESSNQTFGLTNQSTTSNQPIVIPSMPNVAPSDTQYGLEPSLQGHQGGSFQLPATSEEIYREQILRHQQYYVSQSPRNSGDNKMKTMAATTMPFDARASSLEHTNCAEASVLHRERSQRMLPKDVDNSQTFIQQLHSLQTGLSLPTDASTR